jgi:acyl-CoA thioesterase-1
MQLLHNVGSGVLSRMLRPLALLVMTMTVGVVQAGPSQAGPNQILVLGDSLSAAYGIPRERGWVTLLEAALADHVVINASISGETTEGGRQRLAALLEQHEPGVVVIELGGNDGLRGFPLQRIRANLREMVAMSQRAGARVLLLGMKIPPNYGPRYTAGFEQAYIDTAEEFDVPLVPFFLDGVALVEGMMQADGIHPTVAAQERMLTNVLPTLEALLQAE